MRRRSSPDFGTTKRSSRTSHDSSTGGIPDGLHRNLFPILAHLRLADSRRPVFSRANAQLGRVVDGQRRFTSSEIASSVRVPSSSMTNCARSSASGGHAVDELETLGRGRIRHATHSYRVSRDTPVSARSRSVVTAAGASAGQAGSTARRRGVTRRAPATAP